MLLGWGFGQGGGKYSGPEYSGIVKTGISGINHIQKFDLLNKGVFLVTKISTKLGQNPKLRDIKVISILFWIQSCHFFAHLSSNFKIWVLGSIQFPLKMSRNIRNKIPEYPE
jgi:hypothetical protein